MTSDFLQCQVVRQIRGEGETGRNILTGLGKGKNGAVVLYLSR